MVHEKLVKFIEGEIERIEKEFLAISVEISSATEVMGNLLSEQSKLRKAVSNSIDQVEISNFLNLADEIQENQARLLEMHAEKQYMGHYHANLLKMLDIQAEAKSMFSRLDGSKAVKNLPMEELNLIMAAQEEERGRISRQIHDGPAQTVANMVLSIDLAAKYIDKEPTAAKKELKRLKETAMSTLKDIRSFIFELRPMMLDDLGLLPTLTHYVELLKQRNKANIRLTTRGSNLRYRQEIEDLVFRMLQELLTGSVGQLEGGVLFLEVGCYPTRIEINIKGSGIRIGTNLKEEKEHFSLRIIRAQIDAAGGLFQSENDGKSGSELKILLPINKNDVVESDKLL